MGTQPVDRGWAWVVCAATFISMFIAQGTIKILGVYFVEFIERYDARQGLTAVMLGLVIGISALFSPLTMAVAIRFTFRSVIIVGGLFLFLGALLTAWAPNIYVCITVFGIFTGISVSCLLGPGMAILTQYFNKRLTLAMGLATAGGSVGQLVLPILLTYLIKVFSLKGTLLIYGGLSLHVIVAGALMRPKSFYNVQKKPDNVSRKQSAKELEDLSSTRGGGEKESDVKGGPKDENEKGSQGDSKRMLLKQKDEASGSSSTKPKSKADTAAEDIPRRISRSVSCTPHTAPLKCDMSLFKEPLFIAYIFAMTFATIGILGFYHFLPDFARDLNISKDRTALILALTGVFDLLGHLFGGWFGDLRLIRRSTLGALSTTVIGIAVLFGSVFPTFGNVLMMGVVVGFFGGVIVSVGPVILKDWVGQRRFPPALALALLFRGLLTLPGPVILGELRERSGSYQASFWVCSVCALLCAIWLTSEAFARRCRDRSHPVVIVREISVSYKH